MRSHNYFSKFILVIFLIIIILQFSLAQTTITPSPSPSDTPSPSPSDTPPAETTDDDSPALPTAPANEDIPETPEEALAEAKRLAREGAKKSTNTSELEIPELADIFQKPTMFIFSIKDQDKITLDMFVVLIAMFIGLLAMLFELVDIFSDNKVLRFLISFTLALIAAVLGTINRFAIVITKLSPETLLGKTTNMVFVIIGIIIAVIIIIFIKDIIKGLKKSNRLERAERGGVRLGSLLKVAKRRYERQERT